MKRKEFNAYEADDPIFPRTRHGQIKAGMVLESAGVTEAATGPDAMETMSTTMARTKAMAAVLGFVEDGEFNFNALDEYVMGVADLDGDFQIGDAEEDDYNEIFGHVADAMLTLGASAEDVSDFLERGDNEAGARVGAAMAAALEATESDDDTVIAAFAMGEGSVMESVGDDMVLEAAFRKMKVVRGGNVMIARKRISGKVRLSAAQRAGLKKARRKAFTSTARLHRAKSMRIRKARGM